MPSDGKSDDTSVSSHGGEKNQRSSQKSSKERRRSERIKSLVTDNPGMAEQPLAYPGVDTLVVTGGQSTNVHNLSQSPSSEGSSRADNQVGNATFQGLDVATLIQQQLELLQQIQRSHSTMPSSSQNQSNVQFPATVGLAAPVQPTQPVPPVNAQPVIPPADPDAAQVQDDGLANALNLAFQIDPNMGPAIDASIATLIENCLNVPAATSRI